MAKRKLTRQQRNRISLRQQAHVEQQADVTGNQSDYDEAGIAEDTLEAVVICNFGEQIEVQTANGHRYRCYQRSNLPNLVSGDRVIFSPADDDGGVIVAQEPRNTVFSRSGAGGLAKPIAANVDLVIVAIAPAPEPFMNLIDRYLVAIENLDLNALLVINKSDLFDHANMEKIAAIRQLYSSIGYPLIDVSAKNGLGIDLLRTHLQDNTAVIVGQSGVGKSSLLNALCPEFATQVGDLSTAAEKGTHTTTATRLYEADGYRLIDSPGIREFRLEHVESEDLLQGFREFRPLLGHCKFRDCSHLQEPGCALLEAVAVNQISNLRLQSYFQILNSQDLV